MVMPRGGPPPSTSGRRPVGPVATSVDEDDAAEAERIPRARRPRAVLPSAWALPDADAADEDGVVGIGADLAPGTLVDAYRRGIFPWPHLDMPLPWCSPDPRGVIEPGRVRVHRSLRRSLRQRGWVATVDQDFHGVVAGCAEQPNRDATWILPTMRRAYGQLHELGWAHSVEIWDGDDLVGGLYGVQIGAVFTGESMFHRQTDASKAALLELVDRFVEAGGVLIDVQIVTEHLASLGASEMDRSAFVAMLGEHGDADVRLRLDALDVARLAGSSDQSVWQPTD